jgi:hypothetical protein
VFLFIVSLTWLFRSNNNGVPQFVSKHQLTVAPAAEALSSGTPSPRSLTVMHRQGSSSPVPVGLVQRHPSPPALGFRQFRGSDFPGIVDS